MDIQEKSVGPYRLLSPLGKGNMGTVFLAQHQESGRLVALKTVQVPKEAHLHSIRQEIKALAQLEHPGIVKILDEGEHKGLPYYAMELLEGLTLRQWIKAILTPPPPPLSEASPPPREDPTEPLPSWWTLSLVGTWQKIPSPIPSGEERPGKTGPQKVPSPTPLPSPSSSEQILPGVLTLARRLCSSLAYLHGEGLIHRDIKPENILVRARGEERGERSEEREKMALPPQPSRSASLSPVLVDFGLVSQYHRESRELIGVVEDGPMGTLPYMSPEQIKGEPLDARADLYSLGVVLFELFSGRLPFAGARPLEILQAHLYEEPPRLSQFVSGIPPSLDALLLRLLAKKREERPGYALDVERTLAALGAEGWEGEVPRARIYLYRPRLFGRQSQLEKLKEAAFQVEEKGGGLFLLGGESGVGKTRLVSELARELKQGGRQVLLGECEERETKVPLEPLQRPFQKIADFCRERGPIETERILGPGGQVLSLYLPSVSSLLEKEDAPLPELPPQTATRQLFFFLKEALFSFAQKKPLFLFLDDLQWADELSLDFLYFLQESSNPWLWVLGTYRTEETHERLKRLLLAPRVETLTLEQLGGEEVGEIIRDILTLSPPPALRRFLTEQSRGNPFFVAEYVRAAVEEGLLWRDREGRWQLKESEEGESWESYAGFSLPRTLSALLERRLSGLSEDAEVVLKSQMVLGREAPLGLLQKVAGLSERRLLGALGELGRRQILEAGNAQGVRFVHDKLKEVGYARLSPAERVSLHRRVAEALESFRGKEPLSQAELGYHQEEAGEREKARASYLAGARRAAEIYSHEEAERLFRAYLRLTDDPALRAGVRNELGELLQLRGRFQEADQEHQLAFSESRQAREQRLQGESLRLLGKARWQTGKMEEGQEFFEEALRLLRGVDNRQEGLCLQDLANLHLERGQLAEAQGLHERALQLFRETGDRRSEGRCLGNLANIHLTRGQLAEAQALYEKPLSLFREMGDRRQEGICQANLAILCRNRGEFQESQERFEEALRLFHEVGDRRSEGICLENLAILYLEREQLAEAQSLFERVLSLSREVGNRRSEGVCLGNLAGLLLAQGQLTEAQALYEKALSLSREVADPRAEGSALGELAILVHFRTGDLEKALMLCLQGEKILEGVGELVGLAKLLCVKGHLFLARAESAADILAHVRKLARELKATPESDLGRKLSHLSHAQEAFERGSGHLLFRGYFIEDIPLPIREWFRAQGLL